MRNLRRNVNLALVCLLASGCAAIHRPSASVNSLTIDAQSIEAGQQQLIAASIDTLAERAVLRGDNTLDVLMLSGGGQHGAYGAGFLKGWKQRTAATAAMPAIPTFDVITGVSTGALQTPFALLGTPAALEEMLTLYRNAATTFAPKFYFWFWLRKTGGVVNVKKYRQTIARVFDEKMRSALQTEFAKKRQVFITSADMDIGRGHVWNIGSELGNTKLSLQRTHSLFSATSAIPGAFPPVILDGHVHSDGGTISNIETLYTYDDYQRLSSQLTAKGVNGIVTVRVWVVVNLWADAPYQVVKPHKVSAIRTRGNGVIWATKHRQLKESLRTLAMAVNATIPNVRIELRVTEMPLPMSREPGSQKLFDKAWMTKLSAFGLARALGEAPWDFELKPAATPASESIPKSYQ